MQFHFIPLRNLTWHTGILLLVLFVNRTRRAHCGDGWHATEDRRCHAKIGRRTKGFAGKEGHSVGSTRKFRPAATGKDTADAKSVERTDEGGNAAQHNFRHLSTGKSERFHGYG